jgi:hypothetical protein
MADRQVIHICEDDDFPEIVVLCGSTRFWKTFQQVSLSETLAFRIVLNIGAASGTDDDHFGNLPRAEYDAVKEKLDLLHMKKIDLADRVIILNVGGYIGKSTRKELLYAIGQGKKITFLEPMPEEFAEALGGQEKLGES